MLVVSRREYKVMLDHRLFEDRKPAAEAFCRELNACAKRLKGIECDGQFEKTKKRELVFLDTKDHTIHLNRFVFRRRRDLEKDETEYTLKCRSPDRYVAAGADVQAARGLEEDVKLEEDIGAPFVVRFSHSNTVPGPAKAPKTLKDAAKLFPALGRLERDGEACSDELELRAVNALEAYERVLEGPTLRFNKTEAEVALILWSDGADGRPLVAEFSFRYGHAEEDYSPKAARKALELFAELERLDWCRPGARTKTQYTYGE
jgi:hypothetical protein